MANQENRIGENLKEISELLDIDVPGTDPSLNNEYAWYVGVTGNDSEGKWHDYFEQYIAEGRWENGWDNKFMDEVRSIKPGDRIAIKSTSKIKNNLPFENNGQWVGFADIKAIGIVTENLGDGKNIKVNWQKLDKPKRWFSFMGFIRDAIDLVAAKDGYAKKALLDFTFGNAEQDYSLCEDKYCSVEQNEVTPDLSLDNLSAILKEMYLQGKNDKTQIVAIYNFGIKYGSAIAEKIRIEDIVEKAGLDESLSKELRKAVNIYSSIKNETYGLSFASKDVIDNGEDEFDESFSYENIPMDAEQVIYYGAPGTGKSFAINALIEEKYPDEFERKQHVSRVVFHPDYTYSDFIGSVRPVRDKSGDNKLNYPFVPGPLSLLLKKCFLTPNESFYLVLEEINRGNAAAIFGDLFQLLDRENSNELKGKSKYQIKNVDIAEYLSEDKRLTSIFESGMVWFPSNLNIYCTMNTADQNVFVLDSAFKRRFSLKYVPIDFSLLNEKNKDLLEEKDYFFNGTLDEFESKFSNSTIKATINRLKAENKFAKNWPTFAQIVNSIIDYINNSNGVEQISEDKKLGPFFATANDLKDRESFVNKVVYYLKQDVFKYADFYFVDSFQKIYDDYAEGNNDIIKLLLPSEEEK